MTGKQIKSMQYRVSWTSPYITQVTSLPIGAVYLWGAGNIVSTVASTSITVAAAGTGSLDFADPAVHVLQFTISPGAPAGTNIALTVTGFLFNEGKPSVLTANGIIQVRNPTSVGDDAALSFTLGDAVPSPMRASTHIRFTLPRSSDQASPVRLAVFGLDGRRVRSLWDTPAAAGAHDVVWDGRDAVGHPVAPGVYFYRLDWSGQTRSRKLAVVR